MYCRKLARLFMPRYLSLYYLKVHEAIVGEVASQWTGLIYDFLISVMRRPYLSGV